MAKNSTLQAVIFDVDGMLLDTREFIFQAFEAVLAEHGHELPGRAVMARQIGRSLQDCYLAFAPNGDVQALCVSHDTFQKNPERIQLITALPGVHKMLETLQKAGIRMGVFSSRKLTLMPSLVHAGISDFFEVAVQGDEVTHHKPHPEGLFKALAALEIKPERAAMVGDAAVDILAGKAANVALTIGITHGFGTRKELEAADPDHIVDTPAEMTKLLLHTPNRKTN